MTLAEKLLELRTARGLSQGELAERLEVSRQSVSKWETGQSVPEIDKIIKLSDLFGVSVDQLVRQQEGPTPQPAAAPAPPPPTPPSPAARGQTAMPPIHVTGIVCEGMGAGLAVVGIAGAPLLVYVGAALVCFGLPLLLAPRHQLLISGWLLVLGSYLVLNPWTTGTSFKRAVITLFQGELPDVIGCVNLLRVGLWVLLAYLSWRAWQED